MPAFSCSAAARTRRTASCRPWRCCRCGFDEIKNQWGWGGYSTHDIERCALGARGVALVYNWWSWYVRLAHPKTWLEAITSRPKLLSEVGRMTSHGGQKKILLTIRPEAANQIKALVANVRHDLQLIAATAPQLTKPQQWFALVQSDESVIDAMRLCFKLTTREAEVLYWVVKGKINRDIGDILDSSPMTVKKHLERVFAKLGMETRTAAAGMAMGRIRQLHPQFEE